MKRFLALVLAALSGTAGAVVAVGPGQAAVDQAGAPAQGRAAAARTGAAAGLSAFVPVTTPVNVFPVKVSIGRLQSGTSVSYRAYIRGTDARVWSRSLNSAGAPTGPWTPLSGAVYTGPDVVPEANRQTHVLAARSIRSSLVIRQIKNGFAGPWVDLGGSITTAPALALSTDDKTIIAVARGNNGNYWFRLRRGGVWQKWLNLGGTFTSAPDVITNGLYQGFIVSGRASNGLVWSRSVWPWGVPQDIWRPTTLTSTSAVSGWQQLTGGIPASVGVAYAYRGDDAAMYLKIENTPVLERLGGTLTSGPDRDNPGGSKSMIPESPGESTTMVVARNGSNALSLYNLSTRTWTSLGGAVR
jgi:hypothetical protein